MKKQANASSYTTPRDTTAVPATQAASQGIENPYCGAVTIAYPNHPMGAQATMDPRNGQPVILVDPFVETKAEQVLLSRGRGPGGGRAFMRFILAHECAHHVRGHMHQLSGLRQLGPYVLFSLNPGLEAEADCWAAETLGRHRDFGAIQAAADFFSVTQGPFNQPGYPSGQQRARTIARCGGL